MPMGDRLDAWRHRRGEQSAVCLTGGRLLQNRVEIFGEPHVEHFVGFIQHDDLHMRQLQRLAAEMIERPPRGGNHDHVDAPLQRMELRANRLPAVDSQHARAQFFAIPLHRFTDLDGQLAGRN